MNKMWKWLNKTIYYMKWSHHMHIKNIWISSYHNILDFWSAKNLHHNPYLMIMDSLYLLKCLMEWFFNMENSVIPLIQRKKNLKDFADHNLRYTMKYGLIFFFIWINNWINKFFKCKFLIQLSIIDKV
jgi:hypothetical protein